MVNRAERVDLTQTGQLTRLKARSIADWPVKKGSHRRSDVRRFHLPQESSGSFESLRWNIAACCKTAQCRLMASIQELNSAGRTNRPFAPNARQWENATRRHHPHSRIPDAAFC